MERVRQMQTHIQRIQGRVLQSTVISGGMIRVDVSQICTSVSSV